MKNELLEIYELLNQLEVKGLRNISIITRVATIIEKIVNSEKEKIEIRKEE